MSASDGPPASERAHPSLLESGREEETPPTAPRRPKSPTWVETDLAAVRHNLRLIRASCPPLTRVIAVVKANAYGHGVHEVSRAVIEEGAWGLAVARVEEGLELRRLGHTAPVLVLGYATEDELPAVLAHGLTLSVSGWQAALVLSSLGVATGREAVVHLKVDTGMSRYGVPLQEAARFVAALRELPAIRLEGLYTHFATADEPESPTFHAQLRALRALEADLVSAGIRPELIHAANSAAATADRESCFDAVRAGIALYGVQPSAAYRLDLHPVLSFQARVGQLLDVPEGQGVSYGHEYVASAAHRAAVVTCGYADGYVRALGNRGHVLIHGRRCPILGRICMDSIVVGLPVNSQVSIGDEVVLLGSQGESSVTVEELAALAGTIPYELLCGFGRRSERYYTDRANYDT